VRSRGAPPARRAQTVVVLGWLALAWPGCGGEEASEDVSESAGHAGTGGLLTWAVAESPGELDPLLARSRVDQLVTRQIHEPLIESLDGPFGDVRRRPGLALSVHGSADATIWRLRLRSGVRFQDGTRFNAGAVMANGERWRTTRQGRALMPDLFALDAPRPGLVRFFLEAPDPGFPERLASPRAGIVSPRALSPRDGEGAELVRDERTGTGPFELREHDPPGALVARNLEWWGSARGLGPALDQVEFPVVAGASDRLDRLAAGELEVADQLGAAEAVEARRDPLLEVFGGGAAGALAIERSVRGITSAVAVPSLSEVWVTRVAAD